MNTSTDDFSRLIQKASFLGNVSLFAGFSPDYLAGLAEIVRSENLPRGGRLFKQGDFADCLYIVREGKIRISIDSKTIVDLGRFECIGELAVFGEPVRSATATAVTDAVLVRISAGDFKNLLTLHPGMSLALMRTLAQRLKLRESAQYSAIP